MKHATLLMNSVNNIDYIFYLIPPSLGPFITIHRQILLHLHTQRWTTTHWSIINDDIYTQYQIYTTTCFEYTAHKQLLIIAFNTTLNSFTEVFTFSDIEIFQYFSIFILTAIIF